MPHSHPFGKEWAADLFAVVKPVSVLDIGAGSGTWVKALRHRAAEPQHWTAVEVWHPYIAAYDLPSLYDEIIVEDARFARFPDACLAIAGDVLEHVPELDAVLLIERMKWHAKHVLISVPVIHYEQGELEGNPYETHLWHPTHEWVMDTLRPSAWVKGDIVGAYWLAG